MALARCILGKFLGVGCHFFPPPLDVPTFSARCLYVQRHERPLAVEGGTLRGREMFREISSRIRLSRNSRDLLHAENLRHGTDGFTSPPKEGVLRIFSPLKIRRLQPGTKGQHATSRPPKPIVSITWRKLCFFIFTFTSLTSLVLTSFYWAQSSLCPLAPFLQSVHFL